MTSVSKDGAPPRRLALRASRATATLTLIGVLALGAAAGGAYLLAKDIDARQAAERRHALAATIEEVRTLAKDSDVFGPQLVRILENSAGLRDVKLESEPGDAGRETYPLLDSRGRILGFLTWQTGSAMSAAVERLLPIAAGGASALAGLGLMALWHLRHTRRRAEERERPGEDPVTHLPGHDRMRGLIKAALTAGAKAELTLALIELDGAEDVAEHVGPRGSDELLASVAERLKKALPAGASCGRFGTYQFAVLLPADLDAIATLRTMVEQIARPHWIDAAVKVGAHASYAAAPRDADTAEDLIRRTDIALRAAKRKGPGSIVAFEPTLDAEHNDAQLIKRELTGALSSRSLELHYQPIVAASGGKIVGVEALLRWTHATRGAIPPAVFVPIAEQMGLMDEIGTFVLRRALADIGRWPDLYVAINLSPLQVRDRGIVEHIRALIAEAKVAPERVVLEITEGVLIDNPEEIKARLAALRALGLRIALDDFGAGYSNLSYLQSFPFDKLKIDRGFVTALGRSSNGGVIIQAIVALGRALGLSVLAEGVETEEQRVLLRLAGCDEMQGYRFAKPAPAGAIDKLLTVQKIAVAAMA